MIYCDLERNQFLLPTGKRNGQVVECEVVSESESGSPIGGLVRRTQRYLDSLVTLDELIEMRKAIRNRGWDLPFTIEIRES